VIEPGAVFELPAKQAQPPGRAFQDNPPVRDHRWVLIVSSAADCADEVCDNVLVVLLSRRMDMCGPMDVPVLHPNGGVEADSIAQSDIVLTIDRRAISGPTNGPRYRGTVLDDTFLQLRALLRERLSLD
jgi:hypothetical protein